MSDIYEFTNKIINDDCLEVMPRIPDHSIDMILCDLPYGITNRNEWDFIIPIKQLWCEYARLIKENGIVVLTSWGNFSAKLIVLIVKVFAIYNPNSPSILNKLTISIIAYT